IGTDDHEITDFIRGKLDGALDQVVEDERSSRGDLEAKSEGTPLGFPLGGFSGREFFTAESIRPLVALGRAFVGGALAIGAIIAINVPRCDQLVGGPPVAVGSLGLVIGRNEPALFLPLVPVDAL